jgi:hypothetical protein
LPVKDFVVTRSVHAKPLRREGGKEEREVMTRFPPLLCGFATLREHHWLPVKEFVVTRSVHAKPLRREGGKEELEVIDKVPASSLRLCDFA